VNQIAPAFRYVQFVGLIYRCGGAGLDAYLALATDVLRARPRGFQSGISDHSDEGNPGAELAGIEDGVLAEMAQASPCRCCLERDAPGLCVCWLGLKSLCFHIGHHGVGDADNDRATMAPVAGELSMRSVILQGIIVGVFQLAENTENEQVEEKSKKLTDEELLRSAREPYAHFLDSILRIIDSDMTYEQKSLEIKVLTSKMIDEYGSDPAAGYVIDMSGAYAGQILTWYNLQVRHTALNNALNAAIEIYLIYAKTGQIPEKLPDNLSKDPYSSKDFEYKITEDGFILRYRIKPVNEREVRQYEFKVKSKD